LFDGAFLVLRSAIESFHDCQSDCPDSWLKMEVFRVDEKTHTTLNNGKPAWIREKKGSNIF
jgi:hypothetical protein